MLAAMTADSKADRLLDAQVAWLLRRLTGPGLPAAIAADVDDLLEAGSRLTVAELAEPAAVKAAARLLLESVPPSTAASTLVGAATDVAYAGPRERFALSDLIDRENVAGLADEALAMTDLAEEFLDRLAKSPLVTTLAARFVGRIVNDVVQANRAVAEKIPGVGSLVSFGANAAGKVMGAADKQLEQLLGDTAGKGAAFAMRRLNRIIVETLKDPTVKDAVLEVFDLYADDPLPRLSDLGEREDLHRLTGLIQDIVIAGAPTEPVLALVDALIDGFFEVYGAEPASSLIGDLGLTRDDLLAHAEALVTPVLSAAHRSGELERLLRPRLAEFWESAEVTAILAD